MTDREKLIELSKLFSCTIDALLKGNYIGILVWAIGLGFALRHGNETTKNLVNDMSNAVVDAWTTYTNQTANGNQTSRVQTNSNETYTVRHPQSPLKDISPVSGFNFSEIAFLNIEQTLA